MAFTPLLPKLVVAASNTASGTKLFYNCQQLSALTYMQASPQFALSTALDVHTFIEAELNEV
jgi:hypothetical protein